MKQVTCNGELILTLESKQDWVNKVPHLLPNKRKAEQRLWVDSNGNCLSIGEDFHAAENMKSYPVRVYGLQRVAESPRQIPKEGYYVRAEGFIGNGCVWWRPNSAGYTSDIKQAGIYTYEEAFSICKSTHGGSLAYKCSTIDKLEMGLITQVDAQYVPKPDIGTVFGKEPETLNSEI